MLKIKNIKVNIKSDYRVLGATMAGSKLAAPEEELRSYLIGQRISTAASDQLLHVTGHVGIKSVEDPDDDKSEFLTVKQEIIGHWKRVFVGKKWVQTNYVRHRLSTFLAYGIQTETFHLLNWSSPSRMSRVTARCPTSTMTAITTSNCRNLATAEKFWS